MTLLSEDCIKALQSGMQTIKEPTAGHKVYKDECCYSYDTAFSKNGIFVNMSTWLGCGQDFLKVDVKRAGGNIL